MNLPECHSRRPLPGESERFFCTHPQVYAAGRRVSAGACLVCEYSSEPAPDRPVTVAFHMARAYGETCVHLGSQTGERGCSGCGGGVRIKVFRCGHPKHQETTLRDCEFCADFCSPTKEIAGR